MRGRKGYSLVEILVVGTIMGVLGLALVRMLNFSMRHAKSVAQKGQFEDALNAIRLASRTPGFCKCNFIPVQDPPEFEMSDLADFSLPVSEIKFYDSNCNPRNTVISTSTSGPNQLSIKNIEIKDLSRIDDQNYAGKLWIQAEKKFGSAGPRAYSHAFDVLFQTSRKNSTVTLQNCQMQGGADRGISTERNTNGGVFAADVNFIAGTYTAVTGASTPPSGSARINGVNTTGNAQATGYQVDYTVPSGKTLILNSVVASMGACYLGSSLIAGGFGMPDGFSTHMAFRSEQVISLRSSGSCSYLGTLSDDAVGGDLFDAMVSYAPGYALGGATSPPPGTGHSTINGVTKSVQIVPTIPPIAGYGVDYAVPSDRRLILNRAMGNCLLGAAGGAGVVVAQSAASFWAQGINNGSPGGWTTLSFPPVRLSSAVTFQPAAVFSIRTSGTCYMAGVLMPNE